MRPVRQPTARLGSALPRKDDVIGAFRVVDEIARGGMGVIYRVKRTDSAQGAEYALKLVNDAALDPEGLARFHREMEALGRASGHPNVIRVSTSGVDPAGRPYYVMELVKGRSLHERVQKEGPLQPLALARLGVALAGALEHIHAQGIVHRDLKPANVLLREEDGEPILTDFGLASLAGADKQRLTRTQDVLGTPVFMAPEQAMGRSIDPRSDVYGLGAILFAAASGEPPVPPGQQIEILSKVALGQLTPLSKVAPKLPKKLAAIIEKALATQSESRYQTARDMAGALEQFLEATMPDEESVTASAAKSAARKPAAQRLPGPGETRVDDASLEEASLDEGRAAKAPSRSKVVPLLALVVLGGGAALALLVPRALAIRDKEKGSRAQRAVASRVEARREALEKALAAGKNDDAVAVIEDAAAPGVEAGLDVPSAVALVDSAVAPAVGRALAARAAARLGKADARAVAAEVERAIALLGAADPAAAAEMGALRAEALWAAGDDAEADRALAAAAELAPQAAARSALRARLARARVAALDVRGALAPRIEEGCPDATILAFEVALEMRELEEARSARETLERAPAVSSLEKLLAEVALARAEGRSPATTRESLAPLLAVATTLDAARIERALATVEPREARKHLQAAIARTGTAGGRARGVRLDAALELGAIERRRGELESARKRIEAALADARSERWRLRVLVEKGRTAFARDDLLELSADAALVSSADAMVPGADALRALDAREVARSGLSHWTARILGGADGAHAVAFGAEYESVRERAKRHLGVVRAIEHQGQGAAFRDLRALLDTDGALVTAMGSDGWKESGLRGYVSELVRAYKPRDLAAEKARIETWLPGLLDEARLAVDLAPDDPEALVVLLEALATEPSSEVADELRRLATRLERVHARDAESALVLARAAGAAGDVDRALTLTAFAIDKSAAHEATARRIRVAVLQGAGDPPKLRDEIARFVEMSPFDVPTVEPLLHSLTAERNELAQEELQSYVLGGAVGGKTFAQLHRFAAERRRVQKWLAATPEERKQIPALERKMMMDACGKLTTVSFGGVLRAQLFWTRGEIGELSATRVPPEASALIDLAEGVRVLNDRALAFLARIDAAASDPRWRDGLFVQIERIQNSEEEGPEEAWNKWEDGLLIRAALVASKLRADPKAPVKTETLEQALELADEALEENPMSAVARIVRAALLAKVGRTAEAEEDVAAALSIAPELERAEDPWIEPHLEGARRCLATRAQGPR